MGGRFDPVHKAHIQTALDVCKQYAIDVLHLVPTYKPPHRQAAVASFKHRCVMLDYAIKDIKNSQLSIVVDKRESQSENKSYSYCTLQKMKRDYANDSLFLMMGSDAFLDFDTWYNWQSLLLLCTLVIDQRPGDSIKEITEKRRSLLKAVPNAIIEFCKVQQIAVSSSQIRHGLKQGVDEKDYLAPDVLNYIKNQKLYQ